MVNKKPKDRKAKRKPVKQGHRSNDTEALFYQAHQRFAAAIAASNYKEALQAVQLAIKLNPTNFSLLCDLALCQMRCGEYESSRQTYLKIYQLPDELKNQITNTTWLDGLTEVCGWLGRDEDVRRYGYQSLTEADVKFSTGQQWQIPDSAPPAFDVSRPEQNIIAFSLFGAFPRYCEAGVMNAQLAPKLYPGWTCRFYLDNSVPDHVVSRLKAAGAQVVDMSATDTAVNSSSINIPPVMWRFLVMDDKSVSRFMLRDCDALLSERDAAAVDEWLASDKWFHTMRDYFTHTELILAGLWGGCQGIFPPVAELMKLYMQTYDGPARYVDQYFLRKMIWPTLRNSVLCHDELFGFHDARPFPIHPPLSWDKAHFHVGSNASYQMIGGETSQQTGTRQKIIFREQGKPDLIYDFPVTGKSWRLSIPNFMIKAIENGTLSVMLA
ncbi:MAG: tetratricopeptide repeat protein [Enterobacteriaceae bacterium]|jgi:hypothetical protein|nr:tetratricopeptide repeat protein [Enterobacteriaceae bacterium]